MLFASLVIAILTPMQIGTPEADAAPCSPGTADYSPAACIACTNQYGHIDNSNAFTRICSGVAVGDPVGIIPPDCAAMTVPTDRAICIDQYLTGQRG